MGIAHYMAHMPKQRSNQGTFKNIKCQTAKEITRTWRIPNQNNKNRKLFVFDDFFKYFLLNFFFVKFFCFVLELKLKGDYTKKSQRCFWKCAVCSQVAVVVVLSDCLRTFVANKVFKYLSDKKEHLCFAKWFVSFELRWGQIANRKNRKNWKNRLPVWQAALKRACPLAKQQQQQQSQPQKFSNKNCLN